MRTPTLQMSFSMLAAVALCALFAAHVRADEAAFDLSGLRDRANLLQHASWLEDQKRELSLDDVMSSASQRFRPAPTDGLSLGFVHSALWLRFDVTNPARDADAWLLELGYPHLHEVDLYAVHADGRVDYVRAGNQLPFGERIIDYPNFAFPLQARAGETTRFYMHLTSRGALRAPLTAWRLPAFMGDIAKRNAWLWLYCGGIALMVAFNFGVAGLLRSREYVHSGLMLLAQAFVVFTLSGETYQYIAPTYPELATHMHAISYVLLALSIQTYGRATMSRLADPPRSLRLLAFTIPMTCVVLVCAALGPMSLMIPLTLGFSVAMAGFALYMLRTLHLYRELRFHLMAFYVLILTFPVAVIAYANIIKPHPLAFLAANLGCGLHAVFTSLALPQRIREMGDSLARMNTQLQHNVAQLESALLGAEQATKIKDQFMANMSHELRTPLNAIINVPPGLIADFEERAAAHCTRCDATFTLDPGETLEGAVCDACGGALLAHTALRYQGDPDRTVRFLQKIERCGQHLLRMVNDVLDFSKMEAGHLELEPTELSLGQLITETADEISELALRKQIRIELELPPTAVPAYGDSLRLKQVLLNLLSNAIKFSEADSAVLVRWQQEADHDVLSVIDTGIGIAREHHERVFENFEQVHGGQRKYGGTGLGLSISRTLARLHGGELWVVSAEGKGSTFVLRIPRPTSLQQQPPQTELQRPAA